MRQFLLSMASPEFLSWLGLLLLAVGLLGQVAVLVEPFESHWTHKPLGFSFAAIVLIGYVIGHIGDDAIAARFESRAKTAEETLKKSPLTASYQTNKLEPSYKKYARLLAKSTTSPLSGRCVSLLP